MGLSNTDYNVMLNDWYPPKTVLMEFENLCSLFGKKVSDPLFKRAREMFYSAVALAGAYELSPRDKYFMQSNSQSDSPDVMSARQEHSRIYGINLLLTPLEVVEFDEHSRIDDMVDFLKATKLSVKKSYTKNDKLLLVISKPISFVQLDVYRKLAAINPAPSITILGRPEQANFDDFIIFNAYPRLSRQIPFSYRTSAQKYTLPSRIGLHLGLDKEIKFTHTTAVPVNKYDILGLDVDKIRKKFNVA